MDANNLMAIGKKYWWILLVGVGLYFVYILFIADFLKQQRLESVGIPAKAQVVDIDRLNVQLNKNYKYDIKVLVMPEGKAPYEAVISTFCETWSVPKKGAFLSVKIDPDDPQNLIWSSEEKPASASQAATTLTDAQNFIAAKEWTKAIASLEQALKELDPDDPSVPITMYNLACANSMAKEKAAAVRWLGKALEKGFNEFGHIETDPDLDYIRGMKHYKELLEKYKK